MQSSDYRFLVSAAGKHEKKKDYWLQNILESFLDNDDCFCEQAKETMDEYGYSTARWSSGPISCPSSESPILHPSDPSGPPEEYLDENMSAISVYGHPLENGATTSGCDVIEKSQLFWELHGLFCVELGEPSRCGQGEP